MSYVYSGLGGLGAYGDLVSQIDSRIEGIDDEIRSLNDSIPGIALGARAGFADPGGPEAERAAAAAVSGPKDRIRYLESERADLVRARSDQVAKDRSAEGFAEAQAAHRAGLDPSSPSYQAAGSSTSTAQKNLSSESKPFYSGWASAFTGLFSSSPAPAPTTKVTNTYASQASNSSAPSADSINKALQAQRNVALQVAAQPGVDPNVKAQQLQIAAGAEQQIKANGFTPDTTYEAPRAPQAVNLPAAPTGPSALTLMAMAAQQQRPAYVPQQSLLASLGPVSIGKVSTATKVAVGTLGVLGLSAGLFLILRKKS